jgi:alpha-L-fucosidase 2
MLLQSHGDEVHILPALPALWPNGRVRGLRARGDLSVDITWAAGAAREITVTAGRAGRVTVRSPLFGAAFRLTEVDSHRTVAAAGSGESVTFSTRPGGRYVATAV